MVLSSGGADISHFTTLLYTRSHNLASKSTFEFRVSTHPDSYPIFAFSLLFKLSVFSEIVSSRIGNRKPGDTASVASPTRRYSGAATRLQVHRSLGFSVDHSAESVSVLLSRSNIPVLPLVPLAFSGAQHQKSSKSKCSNRAEILYYLLAHSYQHF
jgi:hypothetical protein